MRLGATTPANGAPSPQPSPASGRGGNPQPVASVCRSGTREIDNFSDVPAQMARLQRIRSALFPLSPAPGERVGVRGTALLLFLAATMDALRGLERRVVPPLPTRRETVVAFRDLVRSVAPPLPARGERAGVRGTALLLLAAISLCAGCAYNYDRGREWRVGVFLWGFGDPPGVDWHLDWPRRELTELPPVTYPELPPARPRPPWPADWRAPADTSTTEAQPAAPIEDNRGYGNVPPPSDLASRAGPCLLAGCGADVRP